MKYENASTSVEANQVASCEYRADYATPSRGLLQQCDFDRHIARYARVLVLCPTAKWPC